MSDHKLRDIVDDLDECHEEPMKYSKPSSPLYLGLIASLYGKVPDLAEVDDQPQPEGD
jgi:hypothetical protein|tara:strand:+ start:1291 stop:1464 length:174 start_codon:yes stop_codon:yes gene_type:complete